MQVSTSACMTGYSKFLKQSRKLLVSLIEAAIFGGNFFWYVKEVGILKHIRNGSPLDQPQKDIQHTSES